MNELCYLGRVSCSNYELVDNIEIWPDYQFATLKNKSLE